MKELSKKHRKYKKYHPQRPNPNLEKYKFKTQKYWNSQSKLKGSRSANSLCGSTFQGSKKQWILIGGKMVSHSVTNIQL